MEPDDDPSHRVATDVLVDDASASSVVLVFRSRTSWVGVLAFGSWGLLLTLPIAGFVVAGEVPVGSWPLVALFGGLGLALSYLALRSFTAASSLRVEADSLLVQRQGLGPRRRRRFPLSAIAAARVELWPVSFRHPARARGYPMPRPYAVLLVGRDGRTERLPLVLSRRDAASVASWIVRASDARATDRDDLPSDRRGGDGATSRS